MPIDAVLPLVGADAERATLLRGSLELNLVDPGTCWVVAPAEDHAALGAMTGGWFRLVDEDELVPRRPTVPGWFRQQLLKLAAAELVEGGHYLTLDADVLLMRRLRSTQLQIDGKPIVQASRLPVHDDWYEWAERVLALPRSGWTHGVTPAVMSVAAVRELIAYLSDRARSAGPLRQRAAAVLRRDTDWRTFLLRSVPWTEYALYHTFLEATGRFDVHHVLHHGDVIYGRSVWDRETFDAWDPQLEFADPAAPFFAVVQSKAEIPPLQVRAKLASLLPPRGAG